jgi:hypothetical protein
VRLSNSPIGTEKVIHLCQIFFQPFGRGLIREVLVEAEAGPVEPALSYPQRSANLSMVLSFFAP